MAWANTPANLGDIYQIALAVVGDEIKLREKPIFGFFATYESPLRIACEALDNLLWAVDHDIPSVLLGGPSVGLDSPFTAASALVIHLATALAGVTITQLKQRGAPIAIGGLPTAMDLRTARPSYGAPETCLNTAAAADLANYLKLPFMGTAGASESKKVDAQAGLEAALQILTSGLSGAGMVHDVGFLDCADIGSLQYLILSNEIIGMVKRILRGITVNPETIMLDLLEQVGPGGNYLTEPRSAVLCRKETWIPKILDRDPFILWEQRGSKDTAQRLQEMLDKILETHQPDPLLDGAEGKIQKILEIAEARENSQAAVIVT
jgi:trimethylamine--corrinoid protein Co-methyltransferase